MDSYLTTTQVLLFAGAAQGFILSFVLFTMKRKNRAANRILAAILSVFSLNIVFHTLSHDKRLIGIPFHGLVISLTLMLYGPLLFFYVKYLTNKSYSPGRKLFLNLLPFIICIVLAIPFYIISVHSGKAHIVLQILSGISVTSIFIYMFILIKILRDHAQSIKDSYSSIEKINLRWLKLLISGFTIALFCGFILDASGTLIIGWDIIWLMIALFMYIVGHMGLRQPEIFTIPIEAQPLVENETIPVKKKYEKSTLTPEMSDVNFEKLISFMQTEKPYLNSNLTLPELAESISTPVHHLSQIINERLNQNFFEFINSYRVEEAKKMLVDPAFKNFNILSIGLDAGFNSVSAFNAAFKKHAKVTPSQFRNSNLKQSQAI